MGGPVNGIEAGGLRGGAWPVGLGKGVWLQLSFPIGWIQATGPWLPNIPCATIIAH